MPGIWLGLEVLLREGSSTEGIGSAIEVAIWGNV